MSAAQVLVLPDADRAGAAAAERTAETLAAAVAARGRADLATTGGSAALAIYPRLATAPLRDAVPWPDIHVWWGDDRFVPRDHPLSNIRPFDDVLLGFAARSAESGTGVSGIDSDLGAEPGVAIEHDRVHPFPTNATIGRGSSPEVCAERYVVEMRTQLPTDGAGWPVFDLVLLGIGPDGHFLSVFPGSPAFETDAWAIAIPAPTHVEPHVARVTLNPAIVEAARAVIVVATGAGKADVLGRVLATGDGDPRELPARLAVRSGATWFLDEAAAARIVT